ncbi:MAG TPA: ATP-binding protein [Chitinophagaceae bacterium]|nr:ATP-binding protein [Chitinophagaceae bacterium]
MIIISISGIIFLCAVAIYFYIQSLKKVSRQKEDRQKMEVVYKASMLSVIIQLQEEERKKIGRELHDGIGSILAALKLRMSSTTSLLEKNRENIRDIDTISNIVRNLSHLLSPPELELLGFHEAVESLCDTYQNKDGLQIIVNDAVPGFIPKNRLQLSLSLYRVLQELITNTVKHANASKIVIDIKNEKDTFVVDYFDNGIGFNEAGKIKPGLGMQNVYGRLLVIGATYRIQTSPGRGFRFTVFVDHKHIH